MGLYTVPCNSCHKQFIWFSGSLDQRCQECIEGSRKLIEDTLNLSESNVMYKELTLEQQLIDTLKSAIAAKDDLIDHLKKEIQRLNSNPIFFPPLAVPNTSPVNPLNPFPMMPTYPGILPQQPWQPLQPPYIVTSDTTTSIGDLPPIGSGQIVLTPTDLSSRALSTCQQSFDGSHGGTSINDLLKVST